MHWLKRFILEKKVLLKNYLSPKEKTKKENERKNSLCSVIANDFLNMIPKALNSKKVLISWTTTQLRT
jgi:hypothetical protein